jgi:hypothetical protein
MKIDKIILISVKDSFLNIKETAINWKDDLLICQNENVIINTNAIYKWCYYNIETQ